MWNRVDWLLFYIHFYFLYFFSVWFIRARHVHDLIIFPLCMMCVCVCLLGEFRLLLVFWQPSKCNYKTEILEKFIKQTLSQISFYVSCFSIQQYIFIPKLGCFCSFFCIFGTFFYGKAMTFIGHERSYTRLYTYIHIFWC